MHELTFSTPAYVKLNRKSLTLKGEGIGFLDIIFDPKKSEENIKQFTLSVTDSITKDTETISIKINPDYKIIATNFDVSENGYKIRNYEVFSFLIWEFGGHCYDRAETSVLFFLKMKQLPLGVKCTYDLTEAEAKKIINEYGTLHKEDNVKARDRLREISEGGVYERIEFHNLKAYLKQGRPIVIGMSGSTSSEPSSKLLHAVVAYKIIENGNKVYIILYDSNYPYSSKHWLFGTPFRGFRYATYDITTDNFDYKSTFWMNKKVITHGYHKFGGCSLNP